MPRLPEAKLTGFTPAIYSLAGHIGLIGIRRQPAFGQMWTAESGNPEMDAATYVARLGEFVMETVHATASQQQYLAYLRPGITPAAAAAMEAEITRNTEANVETLGQAWVYLRDSGYHLRTRHPETGEAAYIGGIGADESNTYQTLVSGYDEPWPLIHGAQLHI